MLMKMIQVRKSSCSLQRRKRKIESFSGVKRPSENNQTHQTDDGNSNSKNNQTSRMHASGDRRPEFRVDSDYNPPK